MPTLRLVTVKSSGGDYSTLASAEAGEQGDLVSLDRQLDIECYSMLDTTAVTIDGWTTDATRYIRVFTPSAERHAGVWNTSKYRLEPTSVFARVLSIAEDYTRIEGLQIRQVGTGTDSYGPIRSTATGVLIADTINAGGGGSTSATDGAALVFASGSLTVRNYIGYGAAQANILEGVASGTLTVQNATLAGGTYGVWRSFAGTVTLTNVYCGGQSTANYNGTMTRTTCAHASATVFAGSTASIAHDATNFTNVTAGSEDYHLVSGASATLKTGGTDLSGTFTTDIDGETRSDWSIGADEIVAAPGGLAIPIAMYHYVYNVGA